MFTRNTFKTMTVLAALTATSTLHAATIKVPAHQPTIAAAVSAAVNGDKIVISEGVYFEALSVTLKTDLTIKAKGKVVVDAGGAAYAMSIGLCTNVTVDGLTFRNAATALGRISFGSQNRFKNCTFKGGAGDGVLITGGAAHEVIDSVFQNVPGTGAYIEADSSYIGGCKLVNCGQSLGTPAIWLLGAYLTAESNEIQDDGEGHGIAVGINGGDTHHALVLGNEITGPGHDGIFMDDALECLVMDNVIKDPADDGIDVNSGADGNTLEGNLISGAGYTGMEVSGDQGTMFKNRIKKSGQDGVRIYAASSFSFWFKNKIKQSGQYGLQVNGQDHAFTKNVAKGSANVDLMDDAGAFANDYVDNTFGTIGN